MTCQSIGRPPISIIGFGRWMVSSLIRVPFPPARMTHFIIALCIRCTKSPASAASIDARHDTRSRTA